jgi:5-methylcytosine-specific restriction endonuclease McrA
MTKQAIIDLYGEAEYKRRMAHNKAALRAKYAVLSPEERTKVYLARKPSVDMWTKANSERVRVKNAARAKAAYHKLTEEQRQAYRTAQNERRRSKRAALNANPMALEAFKAKARAKHDVWRDANRDHVNAKSREWIQANPEKARSAVIAASAIRRGGGKMNREYVRFLKTQPCLDCGSMENIEVGHLIAMARGGTNHPLNLVAQCRKCNRRLNTKVHSKAMMVHYIQAATFAA